MGRTNPTYRDQLRRLQDRWADFRRALRRRDKPHFDRLFEYAREYADAGGYLNHESVARAVLVSIDLGQERRLRDLEDRVATLEERLDGTDGDREDARQEA